MTYRKFGSLAASLGIAALTLASSETFAASGTVSPGAFALTHPMPHPSAPRFFRHRARNIVGLYWPPVGDFASGPYGEPVPQYAPPMSGDMHYTYTYDVPWDWAHRYPPAVAPSDRQYVPSCTTQPVTVPGRDGGEQTINVIRCY